MFYLSARKMSARLFRNVLRCVANEKNDGCDAEATAEAATCPNLRFIALKSEAHLSVSNLTLDILRSQLLSDLHSVRFWGVR